MASSYTDLARFEKMANGENSGTWGTKINTVIELIEDVLAGRGAVVMGSDANYTLTTANGSTDEARMAILYVTSSVSLTATRDLIVPTSAKKYVVTNATTGDQSLRVKTSAGSGITVPNGRTAFLICDGTNVVSGRDWAPEITATNLLTATGGRITLTTATAVTTSDVSGATTVYFTPYKGDVIEIWNGYVWVPTQFTELSQTTADSTKSPAAVANNSNYDLFVWNDSGTIRCTRGPAWSSDTARGTGAGTTELELYQGRYVNKVAITNGAAARKGRYVGSIRSDGSAQINDTLAKRHVWNAYNQELRPMQVLESTDSWTYTTATIRQANNSATNQLDCLIGLSVSAVSVTAIARAANTSTGVNLSALIGLDSTSTNSAQILDTPVSALANATVAPKAFYRGFPGIGRHYFAWLERSDATGTSTWYGDAGAPTYSQSGITGELLA